jgi:hypothetical protein
LHYSWRRSRRKVSFFLFTLGIGEKISSKKATQAKKVLFFYFFGCIFHACCAQKHIRKKNWNLTFVSFLFHHGKLDEARKEGGRGRGRKNTLFLEKPEILFTSRLI